MIFGVQCNCWALDKLSLNEHIEEYGSFKFDAFSSGFLILAVVGYTYYGTNFHLDM